MTPLAVITNRLSTRNRAAEKWIDPLLADEKDVIHLAIEDVRQIDETIRRCAHAGARTIVVNGGDGTAGLVFGALLNGGAYAQAPAIALLPGGKTNMTAEAWSLKGDEARALRDVLAHHRAGTLESRAKPRAVMSVRDGDAAARYGTFFGAADIVEGILFCRKHIYPLNMPNAVSHAAAMSILIWRSIFAVGGARPITLARGEEDPAGGTFFVFVATTLERLILGLRPIPDAAGAGALIYASIDRSPLAVLRTLPDLLRRKLGPGKGRSVGRAPHLRLRIDGHYTIDGEMYEASPDRDLILEARETLRFIQLPP